MSGMHNLLIYGLSAISASSDLSATEIGDLGAGSLKGLAGLQELTLNYTNISDKGLQQLTGLRQLRRLNLVGTLVQGEGFRSLKALPALTDVDLTSAPVDDSGVEQIAIPQWFREPDAELFGYHRCRRRLTRQIDPPEGAASGWNRRRGRNAPGNRHAGEISKCWRSMQGDSPKRGSMP